MALDRIVTPVAYSPESDAGNFWRTTASAAPAPPLEGDQTCEVAVIGAGFTGLSAALRLAQAGVDVAVVDAHGPGWGASGRNGGFCCLGGSALEDSTLHKRYGEAAARSYFHAERAAVDTVAETLETHGIDADRHSDGETLLSHAAGRWSDLQEHADSIRARYGIDATLLPREALTQNGMGSPEFHGAVHVPIGFALNPLKYALGLAEAARRAGARIHGQTTITKLVPSGSKLELHADAGSLKADKLILATNGYSSENLPAWMRGRYLPTQSNILVSRPLTEAELQAQGWTSRQMCYDTRYDLHYFRLMPDNRMLFGVRGRVRTNADAWAATRIEARADFERIFPEWRHVETPHFWQGLLCLSRKLTPYVGPIPDLPGAYTAFAYHGNGVAMGSHAGRLVADLVLGRGPIPEVLAAETARFPFGRQRRVLLWGARHLHRLQNRFRSAA